MPDISLDDVINGRLTATEIVADGEFHVLAVDGFESWAAVFQFQVSQNGEFDSDAERFQRDTGSRWDSLGSGGGRGIGWQLPWNRPDEGWGDDHLLGMGLSGSDVEDAEENSHFLIAVYGFASAATTEIRVRAVGWPERTIVPAATGAFVALALGHGDDFVELTPLRSGTELGGPTSYPWPT